MKKILVSFYLFFFTFISFSQQEYKTDKFNFDFEKIEKNVPLNWKQFGSFSYIVTIDSVIKNSGKYSAVIEYHGTSLDFKAWAYTIPGSYDGKKVTISGFIKTENVADGFAGLWIRIDPQIAFDNMQKNGIKGTTNWQKYEITLDLNPAKTKQIVVGGLLVGTGKMWIDNLKISIDGKDISELKPMAQKEFLATNDKEFDNGSKVSSFNLTESNIEDLYLLGKLWGFLKYYHPSVANGTYNWDYELFRVMPKILNVKNKAERNNILFAWVENLGKINIEKEKINKKDDIKISPDLAWIDSVILGNGLTSQLNNIKNAKRQKNNYYVSLAEGVGNPVFEHENPYATMDYPDAGFRILSLYRYWNIIQYYFPYKNLIEENWNDVLKEFIPKFSSAQNELEYKQAVLSIIARIHDTHANIWGKDSTLEYYKGIKYSPYEITFIDNKAVITDYYDSVLGKKSGLNIGDVIEAVNNKSTQEIIKEKLPLTPASNYSTQLRNIAQDFLRTNDSLITIEYTGENVKSIKNIQCYNNDKINLYAKFRRKDTCFKFINSNIAYFYPGSIKNEYLPKIIPEILKTEGLIIDFRCYPSDFIVFSLSDYLLPNEKDFVKFSNGSISSPGLFTMTSNLSVGKKNKNAYKGKVVIIVNELTQSSAEYHVMAFKTIPGAVVIGSTTAGADGNVSQFALPGGISTMISGIGVYYPNGQETQRVGIIPDIIVKPTIKGIKENKDELLEKAIEIINKK